jgi:transcriptional regulator with XRE-family HTH domain
MLRLRIKEIAEKQNLNRNQLQLKSGVTLPLLTRYWNNKTESVTLDALDKIAHALGVKGTDLLIDVTEDEHSKENQQ